MHVWKVLVIAVLACTCLGLTMATILIGLDTQGSDRWLWMGGLLTGTLVAGGLFTLFLRLRRQFHGHETRLEPALNFGE